MPKTAITPTLSVGGYDAAITSGPKPGLFNVYLATGPDNPWTPAGEVESASYPVSYFDGTYVGVDSLASQADAEEMLARLVKIVNEQKGR